MRSRFLKKEALAISIGTLLPFQLSAKEKKQERAKPNILLVVADDQSFPHAGVYGCSWVRTPAFDYVAAHGILVNNCYTSNAKSSPSRASLITGLYSWQLEEAGNHIPNWPIDKYPTIFETLSQKGYYAGYTGKGWAPGTPGTMNGQPRELVGRKYTELLCNPPTPAMATWDYTNNFRQFLSDVPEHQPWIFWMGIREPHRPYEFMSSLHKNGRQPQDVDAIPAYWPDNDTVRTDMLDYAYEIEYYDTHMQRVLDLLRSNGQLDNTLIIWTADNGMPFPRRKGQSYECSTHVPMAIMWTNGIKNPGRQCHEYVNLIDIVPTIMKLTGYSAQDLGMETPSGAELTDILQDRPSHRHDYLLFGRERHDAARPHNQGYPIRGIIEDGYLYIYNFKPELWPAGNPEMGYRDTDSSPTKSTILNLHRRDAHSVYWHLCFDLHPQEELYHVEQDRDCIHNLAAAQPQRMARMKAKLFRLLQKQQDPRLAGRGDAFDGYPFYRKKFWNLYENIILKKHEDPTRGLFWESDVDVF
ncbi:MAG: sulfatase [Bacteroidaceae bacterium]|nr:sulfatase [Bacteroidaceae bacterium]